MKQRGKNPACEIMECGWEYPFVDEIFDSRKVYLGNYFQEGDIAGADDRISIWRTSLQKVLFVVYQLVDLLDFLTPVVKNARLLMEGKKMRAQVLHFPML